MKGLKGWLQSYSKSQTKSFLRLSKVQLTWYTSLLLVPQAHKNQDRRILNLSQLLKQCAAIMSEKN